MTPRRLEEPVPTWTTSPAPWSWLTVPAGALLALGASLLIVQHRLADQPVFSLINVAVTSATCALGLFLWLRRHERFSGLAMLSAGAIWILTVPVDKWGGFWPLWSYIGTGLFWLAFAWSVARYDRPRLEGFERPLPVVGLIPTFGLPCLFALFTEPVSLGFPSDTRWVTLTSSPTLTSIAAVLSTVAWMAYCGYFIEVCRRRLKASPPIARASFAPLAVAASTFGALSVLTIGATIIFAPRRFDTAYTIVGVVVLLVLASVVVTVTRQRLSYGRIVANLPPSLDPSECEAYLSSVLADDAFRIASWSPEENIFIDVAGKPEPRDPEVDSRTSIIYEVCDDDRRPVIVVRAGRSRDDNPATVAAVIRVLELLARNIQLTSLLQMRVSQLTFARRAESLARERGAELFRRDLHDGVQQTVIAARLDAEGLLETLSDSDSAQQVKSISHRLDLAAQEIRRLARGSAEPLELHEGLIPAIRTTAADLRLTLEISVERAVPQLLETIAYYFIKEALVNVHKHAGVGSARVEISNTGAVVTIAVEDEGAGAATIGPGGGLRALQQRVEDFDGSLTVRSQTSVGTTVKASFPCVYY